MRRFCADYPHPRQECVQLINMIPIIYQEYLIQIIENMYLILNSGNMVRDVQCPPTIENII